MYNTHTVDKVWDDNTQQFHWSQVVSCMAQGLGQLTVNQVPDLFIYTYSLHQARSKLVSRVYNKIWLLATVVF